MAAINAKTLLSNSAYVTCKVVTTKHGMGCDMVAKRDLATPLSSHQRSQARQRILWHYECADNLGAARGVAQTGRSECCPVLTAFGSPTKSWGVAMSATLADWLSPGLAPSEHAFSARVFVSGARPAQAGFAGKQLADDSAFALKQR